MQKKKEKKNCKSLRAFAQKDRIFYQLFEMYFNETNSFNRWKNHSTFEEKFFFF